MFYDERYTDWRSVGGFVGKVLTFVLVSRGSCPGETGEISEGDGAGDCSSG